MSSVYVTEPPTRGKVLLHTSYGDVDVELWPKEAPKACRNFVQLCLDGYYNDVIFHRIIKGLFAQTGDPTGTGTGGEAIYPGGYFSDELHQRLKFSHRGQVACANLNVPNSNTSQFFITFEKCPWLDKKHTIFGKVTGNTIFNILRMSDIDVDKDDRPHEPPRLLSAEVLDNPFEDMVARMVTAAERSLAPKRGGSIAPPGHLTGHDAKHLLSFGGDDDDEETGVVPPQSATAAASVRPAAAAVPPVAPRMVSAHEMLGGAGEPVGSRASGSSVQAGSVGVEIGVKRRREPEQPASREGGPAAAGRGVGGEAAVASAAAAPTAAAAAASEAERLKEQIRAARRGSGPPAAPTSAAVPVLTGAAAAAAEAAQAERDLLSPLQQMRARFAARKAAVGGREADTLAKLAAFQAGLRALGGGGGAGTDAAAAADAAAKAEAAASGNAAFEKAARAAGAAAAAAAAAAEPAGAAAEGGGGGYAGQVTEEDGADAAADGSLEWMRSRLHFTRHVDDAFRRGDEAAAAAGRGGAKSGPRRPHDDGLVTEDPLRDVDSNATGSGRLQRPPSDTPAVAGSWRGDVAPAGAAWGGGGRSHDGGAGRDDRPRHQERDSSRRDHELHPQRAGGSRRGRGR